MTNEYVTNVSFDGMGIAPKILETLDGMKFVSPTPIQHKAIPLAIEGDDIIGVAQTGTGKTMAFAIPVIQSLSRSEGKCLVLVPTRELAVQVNESFRRLAPKFGIRTTVIIGGASMKRQITSLSKGPRVIIATPGRLLDHMKQKNLTLKDVSILVLDEADRMLDMGFKAELKKIMKKVPEDRQTMLFSATIPGEIVTIGADHMKMPVHVEVAPSGTAAENVTQELFIVKRSDKKKLLTRLLREYRGSVLLFARTKRGASKLKRLVKEMGIKAAEIHSDRTQRQRQQALEGFKVGRYRVLVATDIAARGIDIVGIETVINFDLPDDSENYVHRIGRTGRAGHEGRAISFATPEQKREVRVIEDLIDAALPVSEHPDVPSEQFRSGKGGKKKGGAGRFGRRSSGPKASGAKGRKRSSKDSGKKKDEKPKRKKGSKYSGESSEKKTGGAKGKKRFSKDAGKKKDDRPKRKKGAKTTADMPGKKAKKKKGKSESVSPFERFSKKKSRKLKPVAGKKKTRRI